MKSCFYLVDVRSIVVLWWYWNKIRGGAAMYNEARKMDFLAIISDGSKPAYKRIFQVFEEKEAQTDTDLCLLSTEDISDVISSMRFKSEKTLYALKSRIRRYTGWCKEHHYPVRESLGPLEYDPSFSTMESMFSSPRHIQEFLDKAFAPVENKSLDSVYRCLVWLLYGGMTIDQAREVVNSDVDLTHMLVRGQYELYRESVPAFHAAMTAKEFWAVRRKSRTPSPEPRAPGDLLLRGTNGTEAVAKKNVLTVYFTHRKGVIKPQATPESIRMSGAFFRIFEAEAMGYKPDFTGIALDRMGNITSANTARFEINKQKMISTVSKEYQVWKRVFYGSILQEDTKQPEAAPSSSIEVRRLAAFEKSGLQPAEVESLAEAKKEGRLIVFPPKRDLEEEIDPVKIRKSLNMSQAEFAKLLGVNPASVSAWESGTNKPYPIVRKLLYLIQQDNSILDTLKSTQE